MTSMSIALIPPFGRPAADRRGKSRATAAALLWLNSVRGRHVSESVGHLSVQMFPVIGRSRFLTEDSWRTMDGEASTKETAAPG